YVLFSDEEIKALEAARDNAIEITEFVPIDTVDFVHVEKSYYLGPDKGGDKAYRLLSAAMQGKDRVAVGRWAARGKERLVLVRPYGEGLSLQQHYYKNEVRSCEEVDTGAKRTVSDKERELAERLIDQLTTERFQPEKYSDSYSERVRAAVEQKVQGEQVTVAPEVPKAQIIDLFEALKRSLEKAAPPEAPAAQPRPPRKATKTKEPRETKKASKA